MVQSGYQGTGNRSRLRVISGNWVRWSLRNYCQEAQKAVELLLKLDFLRQKEDGS